MLVGALVGGILVAAAAVALSLFWPHDKLIATEQSVPGTPRVQQSSVDDLHGTGDVDGLGEYTELLRTARDFEGTSALYQALAQVNQAELTQLLGRSKRISSPNLRLYVQRAIFQRFASLNPKEALRRVEDVDWQHRDAILARVYAERSIFDLDAAVASIRKLDSKRQKVALESLLSTRDDLTDSHRQDLARSFDAEELVVRLDNESQTFEFLDDPKSAWKVLTSDGFDLISQLDLATNIAEQWMEQSGFEVLPQILESSKGKLGYDILVDRLVASATESNPQGFLDFTLGLDSSVRGHVLGRFSYVWGRTDPFAASQAVFASQPDLEMRTSLQIILRQWARSNPQELFDIRSLLPRQVQLDGLGYALTEIAKTDPEQALNQLASIEGEWDNAASTFSWSLIHGWADSDPHAALEWVTSNSKELGSSVRALLSKILGRLAKSNPQEALSIALSQPVSTNVDGIELTVIEVIARSNLDAAIEMLPQLRNESKPKAYWGVSEALVEKGQAKRALKLAQDLPESDRKRYFNNVLGYWALRDSKGLSIEIGSLPSEELKSLAAYHLAMLHEGNPVLTKEQLDHAKTFMKEREIERLKQWQD